MNRLSVIITFASTMMLFPLCLNAQDEEIQTLFSSDKISRIGTYGTLEAKGTQLDTDFSGLFLGGKIGLVFNDVFVIGGAGYGLIPTKKITCPIIGHENENNYLTGGYGGLYFEYINSPSKLLHFTANAFIGCGSVTYKPYYGNNGYDNVDNSYGHPSSFVVVIEPGIDMELNVSKMFKMALGASYRYSPNFKMLHESSDILPTTAFNGVSFNLKFKFDFNLYNSKDGWKEYTPPTVGYPVIIY